MKSVRLRATLKSKIISDRGRSILKWEESDENCRGPARLEGDSTSRCSPMSRQMRYPFRHFISDTTNPICMIRYINAIQTPPLSSDHVRMLFVRQGTFALDSQGGTAETFSEIQKS